MKNSTSLLVVVVLGIILTAGCTGPASPAAPVTETPASVSVPGTESMPSPAVTEIIPTTKRIRSDPPITPGVTVTATTRIASDNPFLEYLNVRKRTFDYPLPNCFMQTAFPGVLKNTYGIKQVEPNLAVISEDDYLTFLRKNTEDNAENSKLKTPPACMGSAPDPTWNFIEVKVILDPTNVRPNNYTITQNIWSEGKVVTKFPTTRSLSLGEKVTLLSYIPVRSDEVDLFDHVEVTYTRL